VAQQSLATRLSHELLKNRGACGVNWEQPTANSQQPQTNSRIAKGKEIKS
jgi:hypothetical protein